MSHINVKTTKPTKSEDGSFDESKYMTDKHAEGSARKGKTKMEASDNTNIPNPAGHERKVAEKLQNSEKKAKE